MSDLNESCIPFFLSKKDKRTEIEIYNDIGIESIFELYPMYVILKLDVQYQWYNIKHEELWDETAYIMANFKRLGMDYPCAQKLVDQVEENWETLLMIRSGSLFAKCIPGEMKVIPRAFQILRDGISTHIIFENQCRQVVKLSYWTS